MRVPLPGSLQKDSCVYFGKFLEFHEVSEGSEVRPHFVGTFQSEKRVATLDPHCPHGDSQSPSEERAILLVEFDGNPAHRRLPICLLPRRNLRYTIHLKLTSKLEPTDCKTWLEKPEIAQAQTHDALVIEAGTASPSRIQALLDYGADVNVANAAGETALSRASSHGRTDVVKLLLDRGADPRHRDHSGHSALDYARARKHTDIVKLLEAMAGEK